MRETFQLNLRYNLNSRIFTTITSRNQTIEKVVKWKTYVYERIPYYNPRYGIPATTTGISAERITERQERSGAFFQGGAWYIR